MSWIDTKDQAILVRKALKREFPDQKFSVTISRYSGGSSIDVRWTDGPTTKEVDEVTGPYRGGGFDGMIDMSYSVSTWLYPDGTVSIGSSCGTEGAMGVHPSFDHKAIAEGAKKVQFAAKYIFCQRVVSYELMCRAAENAKKTWGDLGEFEVLRSDYDGSGGIKTSDCNTDRKVRDELQYLSPYYKEPVDSESFSDIYQALVRHNVGLSALQEKYKGLFGCDEEREEYRQLLIDTLEAEKAKVSA